MTVKPNSLELLFADFKPLISEVQHRRVQANSFRLTAASYAYGYSIDEAFILEKRANNQQLNKLASVFGFGRFKRIYIKRSDLGIPFLSSSDILEVDPIPEILSKANCPKWSQYQVYRGWILISCSGTIGNVALVRQKWDGWSVSQHAIRIVPNEGYRGVLYTFFKLPWVKQVVVGLKSGSVIDEIYPEDLIKINVPALSENCIRNLDEKTDSVLELRDSSDKLLGAAVASLLNESGLPNLNDASPHGAKVNQPVVATWVRSSKFTVEDGFGNQYRLDAHYYNPTAELAIANLKRCRSPVKPLRDVVENVFMGGRFKRNYVEADHGVPFLSGKNIAQIRPADVKHLTKLQDSEIQPLLLKRGWTLITRSGTIGRTCFVWKNHEDYAASEHVLRVIPDESKIDAGYLYAFLSSSYGYEQILRYRHGSVIDEVTDKQIEHVLIPYPSPKDQETIGDMVREAYEKRAEAIRLEDEAQAILMNELTKVGIVKGV